jgi:hypothetical protein
METDMAWALRAMMGLALAFTAGAAMAGCPGPCGGYQSGYSAGYGQDGYLAQDSYYEAPPSYDELSPSYGYARQHYAGGSAAAIQASYYGGDDQGYAPPPCRCETRGGYSESYSSGAGEVSVPYSFFYDNGGVGPIPSYDDYGGGGGYAIASGGGSSFASASSHVSVSVRARGGFHGGGHHGGGCGCK